MPDGPRRNERRFYSYPLGRVVAAVQDDRTLEAALAALAQAGVDVSSVNVLTGPEGAQLLDRSGREHGLRGRLTRLLQRGAFENEALDLHEATLRSGGSVVYVPTSGQPPRDQVAQLLRSNGAHALLHFRRWSVEPL